MKVRLWFALWFSLAAMLLATTSLATAAGPNDTNIVISEVMFNSASINGSDETPYEWVEIYNKGATDVNLNGWMICDELATNCDALSGTIPPGEYWLIANNTTDLTTELNNYSASVNPSQTIELNSAIGNNGLTNSGDAVFLLNGASTCGGGTDACVVDCISWDSTNTCATLVGGTTGRAYLPGADGYDDTALTSNEQNGQSIVNIQGTWYQSGPGTNQSYQASPYAVNVAESGSPTAITLHSLAATPVRASTAAWAGVLLSLLAGGLVWYQRYRFTAKTGQRR